MRAPVVNRCRSPSGRRECTRCATIPRTWESGTRSGTPKRPSMLPVSNHRPWRARHGSGIAPAETHWPASSGRASPISPQDPLAGVPMLRGWPGFRPADPPRWQPGPSIPNARHHQYRQRGAHCRGIPAATVWSPEMRRPGAAEQPRTRCFVVVPQWARRGSTLQSEAAAVLQWHQAAGECPRADAGTDRRPRPVRPWEPKMRTRHSRYELHPDLVVRTAPPSPHPVCSGVPRRNSPTQRSPWAPSSTRRTPAV